MVAHAYARALCGLGLAATMIWLPEGARGAENVPLPETNVVLRGSLNNCRVQFERQRRGHVAFLGGSITEMNGYRPMVCAMLQKRFPQTEFAFTDAGISSTCSTTGAFRLQSDVLSKGPVDLFFVEFAVNDDQDAHHTRQECIRGMEGIVRQCRQHNPAMDIVITYFVNPEMLTTLQSGKTPLTMGSHEEVAKHYGVSTIHLGKEVAEQITAGKLTWEKFGGVHPAPYGNAIATRMIEQLLDRAWKTPLGTDAAKRSHSLPEPLDPLCYANGRFVAPEQATIQNGWKLLVPDWKTLKGSSRSRFTQIPMLCANQPGATATLEFAGTAVGAYVVAGPDAGMLEVQIDGGPTRQVNLLHKYSANLHYPRTIMLGTDLKAGRHTLTFRVSSQTAGAGHAVRIMQFTAN